MQFLSITAAPGWWLLVELPHATGKPARWRRFPLAAWALVEDVGNRWVVGLEAAGQDHVTIAREGTHRHDANFATCGCTRSKVEDLDPTFCSLCAGLVAAGG